MACSVNFDLDSFDHAPEISYDDLASPDSCFDEDVVHDSFAHLLSEQSHQEIDPSEVIELEDLPTVGFENLGYHSTPAQKQEWLEADCYDPATMKVLAFMPSRTIGRSKGAIISEYYNRTLRLRKKRIRPALKDMPRSMRPSIRDANAVDGNYEEELEKKKLLGELQQMPLNDRIKMLQSMPLNLAMKRELRRMTSCRNVDDGPLETNRLPCWSRAKYSMIIATRQCWYGFHSNLHSLQLWQIAQKQISGRFGMGVLSYFIFLKMLLMFNTFLLVLNLCFIVIPQVTNPPETTNRSFVGLELLYGTVSKMNLVYLKERSLIRS